MKLIKLNVNRRNKHGQMYAMVGDSDYDLVIKYNWHAHLSGKTFYARTTINGKRIFMHELLLGKSYPEFLSDHIDRNGLNNQRDNIRKVTHQQNCCNRRHEKWKHKQYIGITQRKENGRWRAAVGRRIERKNLGTFATAEEAARAYDKGAKEMYGEFAQLNFPDK